MKNLYNLKLWFSIIGFILVFASSTFAQNTVSGTVVDAEGEPIIGASVILVGTDQGTITDLDGKFSISPQEGVEELLIS